MIRIWLLEWRFLSFSRRWCCYNCCCVLMWETLIFISFCLAEIMFLGFSTRLNRIEYKTTVSIANLYGYLYYIYIIIYMFRKPNFNLSIHLYLEYVHKGDILSVNWFKPLIYCLQIWTSLQVQWSEKFCSQIVCAEMVHWVFPECRGKKSFDFLLNLNSILIFLFLCVCMLRVIQ